MVLSFLASGQAVSGKGFPEDAQLFAPPVALDDDALSLHALASEISMAELRVAELLDRYQRVRMAQTWGAQSPRVRLFDMMAANHVHGPTCIHFYESPYDLAALPDTGQDAEKAREALHGLRNRVDVLQGRVSALERGVVLTEGAVGP